MSDEIPKPRPAVAKGEAERLRALIRRAEFMNGRIAGARLAQPGDAVALARLLSHESIGPRIYTMPNPINAETMGRFIAAHLDERKRGEGILFAAFNAVGEATACFDVDLWPKWSIARFGGAVEAQRQGRGFGGACGLAAARWCFEQLGVARICETTARDNDSSIRLLSRLGFVRTGEVISIKPDGGTRPSIHWEMSSEDWRRARSLRQTG